MKTSRVPHRWAEHKDLAAVIRQGVRKYIKLFGLEKWDITVEWAKLDHDKGAECGAEPEYYTARITFDLDRLRREPAIDAFIIHELLHIILWPFTDAIQTLAPKKEQEYLLKLEERIVSDLERLPLWEYVE